jgi:hypothetical protein
MSKIKKDDRFEAKEKQKQKYTVTNWYSGEPLSARCPRKV